MTGIILAALVALIACSGADAFLSAGSSRLQSIQKMHLRSIKKSQTSMTIADSMGYLEIFAAPLRPLVPSFPEIVLHWGHPAAMTTVLLVQCGIGAYFGWKVRKGEGNDSNFLTLGNTMRQMHPIAMGGALLFFLIGSQGGLLSLYLSGKPITESAHFVSGIAGLATLGVQALIPLTFEKGGKTARDLHTYFGTATLLLLLVHAFNGIQLGLATA